MAQSREILWLDPRSLEVDPHGLRREQTDDDLEGLAMTIHQFGILQPLGVRRIGQRYRLVYGSRRRQASIIAGLLTVPCVEVDPEMANSSADPTDDGRVTLQLLENLQRRDLNDMEKAEGFSRLRRVLADHGGLSGQALDDLVARTLGLSVRTLQRYLKLLDLPSTVRRLIADGDLTVTQAQHLPALADPTRQEELARAAADRGLSAAMISRVSAVQVRQPGLSIEDAIDAALRGDHVPDIRPSPSTAAPRMARPPRRSVQDESTDADLWPDDRLPDDLNDVFEDPVRTADGHRVFRIRSVDAFCDEVSRLTRALQDGDLARATRKDRAARHKLGLARRQIEVLARGIEMLLETAGQ